MGNLMRHYWIPSMMSSELPSPDCPPVRLRILGEDLIAYRTTSGEVGTIANACPHRGASLFFGRNEEEGLRCVYHGWKFDVAGNCVDMPSEPAESNFKAKVRATAYPARERSGLVWIYMGPRSEPPPLPALRGNIVEDGVSRIGAYLTECNWLQSLEGDFDTIHVGFLHSGGNRFEDVAPPDTGLNRYTLKTRWARWIVTDSDLGCTSGAYRPAEEDTTYWRIAQFLFPFYCLIPAASSQSFIAVVPVDDEHCMRWTVSANRPGPTRSVVDSDPVVDGIPSGWHWDPSHNTSDWYGRFRPAGHQRNDYLIDRELQRSNRGGGGFSGIASSRGQDGAVTESMGVIYQRNQEHLATTDSGIIRMRRLLVNKAKELRDHGTLPPGVDRPELYAVSSLAIVLPNGENALETTRDMQWRYVLEEASKLEARQ
jgi:phenylpropionate dioxygenase-like ring-hydroxylating dioxygenase large terminal subunit